MTDTITTPPNAHDAHPAPPIGYTPRGDRPESRPRTQQAFQARNPGKAAAVRRRSEGAKRAAKCLASIVALAAYVIPLTGMWVAMRPILM
jgi:hypothetical protein